MLVFWRCFQPFSGIVSWRVYPAGSTKRDGGREEGDPKGPRRQEAGKARQRKSLLSSRVKVRVRNGNGQAWAIEAFNEKQAGRMLVDRDWHIIGMEPVRLLWKKLRKKHISEENRPCPPAFFCCSWAKYSNPYIHNPFHQISMLSVPSKRGCEWTK